MKYFQPASDKHQIAALRKRVRNLERRFPAARTMPIVLDGAGSDLVSGIYGDVAVHFTGIITRWRLLAIETGDLQVDLWKADYASFPPTVTDSITGSDTPTLAGTDHDESTALTGWTTLINDGETFRVNIDSVSGITRATLLLTIVA